MTIWFVFALMTGAAVLSVLWPLSRRPQAAGEGMVDDTAFFRQQIADIEREVARGLLPETEGDAARAEAGRRLLRAVAEKPAEGDQRGEPALRRRRAASAIAISIIPLVALTLYGASGRPDVPDAPFAGRMATSDPRDLDLNEAVARVEGHLARQPDDGRGWEVLAPIYLRAGRFDDAARAYGEALRLNGMTADRLADWAEAMVMAAQGVITAEARAAFDKALTLETGNPKAAYYRALATDQDGDKVGALNQLRQLLASSPTDAPWRPAVAARLAALQDPTQTETGQAIAGLAPEQRMQAIRSMVAQLAARVDDEASSVEDWLRLIRSYVVLGEKTDASAALARARARFTSDLVALRHLDALAQELQISSEKAPVAIDQQGTENGQ
ncbi:c-type cytochrome biogenesis protein CcmI [Pseudochelatococcus sp. G4_1912]|uniref:c-type cytochrome biogenesis protein CcmI n=1 Tax=Pseudochelatococcus sp. G4_1912 TaxID=3114288 RepID=UPI0039C6B4A9